MKLEAAWRAVLKRSHIVELLLQPMIEKISMPFNQKAPRRLEPQLENLRSSLCLAHDAWRRGSYDESLSVMKVFPEGAAPTNSIIADAVLLRSRVQLRTNRAKATVEELAPILDSFTDLNQSCVARMLHATAVARAIDVRQGIVLLEAVHLGAQAARHLIRVEILYYKALALWTAARYDEADTYAKQVQDARADILSVRATELRAYCAIGVRHNTEALGLFKLALKNYKKCVDEDAYLASKIALQIANFEQMLRSASAPGSHEDMYSRRFTNCDSKDNARSFEKMRTLQMDSWLFALDGNGAKAYQCLREAEELAPSVSWKVGAIANRGLLAAWFKEGLSGKEHVLIAGALARSVDWNRVSSREELVSLFALIEAMCAVGLPATEFMTTYDRAAAVVSTDVLSAEGINATYKARVDYVRGLVRRSLGDAIGARELLMSAYARFSSAGYLWRAALALIELDATPAPTTARGNFHLETAALLVREHFPASFLSRRLGRWGNVYQDPIARKLTPAQREVLRYALDGHGALDIASLCGRAEKTVRKHLTALHEAFGVDTTLRLVAVCHARGLGSPAWESPVVVSRSETG